MQTRIPGFDDALWHLETLGDRDVVQYQMGCPELAVCMDEHLGFQDLVQTRLVHKIEVGNSSVPICKTIRR